MKSHVRLDELLDFQVANSQDTQDYEAGDVPFVTSAESRNGVVASVTPRDGDKVFAGPCLVISGLGFATVHTGKILPKGNGGDSCTVCYGKKPLSIAGYLSLAAAFNLLHKWRFSYGRKCGVDRLKKLEVPAALPTVTGALDSQKKNCELLLDTLSENLTTESQPSKPQIWQSKSEETVATAPAISD